jgi:hypothetical protein
MRIWKIEIQIRMSKETQNPKHQSAHVVAIRPGACRGTRRLSRFAYIVAPGGRQADRPAADVNVLS